MKKIEENAKAQKPDLCDKFIGYTVPEGLLEVPLEEIKKNKEKFGAKKKDGLRIICDEEKEIIIQIMCRRIIIPYQGIAVSQERMLAKIEKVCKEKLPDYKRISEFKYHKLDNKYADGYTFSFTGSKGKEVLCEYYHCRSAACMCIIECSYEKEHEAYARKKIDEFLSSVKWKLNVI